MNAFYIEGESSLGQPSLWRVRMHRITTTDTSVSPIITHAQACGGFTSTATVQSHRTAERSPISDPAPAAEVAV